MYFCYLDESGTPELTAQTSHFVLLGIAIPAAVWHEKDQKIDRIKQRHGLSGVEVHTGWMMRPYPEQESIQGFVGMNVTQRRREMETARRTSLRRTLGEDKRKRLKKLYAKTAGYTHLTQQERIDAVHALASEVGAWSNARMFAEAVNKSTAPTGYDVFAKSFEQVVTRFHTFLKLRERERRARGYGSGNAGSNLGLLIQDNNQTVAKNLTELMRRFHSHGTFWSDTKRIIETPLFVDSSLTSLVQVADICSYATRRFFENNEDDLFQKVFPRFDMNRGRVVGIRHYTAGTRCTCRVCVAHGRQ
jgi:hypothetical protein